MRLHYYCTAIVVLAIALAGCSKAEFSPERDDAVTEENGDEIEGEVIVKASLPTETTRTTYSYNEDSTVMKVGWAEGDVIYAVSSGRQAAFTQKGSVSGDGKTAYFTKTSGSLRGNRAIIFGYRAVEDAYPGTNSTMGTYVITSQTGALSDMKYYDILTCCTKVESDGTVPTINFVRQVAWLKLSDISFDSGESGTVSQIYLTGQDFHNFIYVNSNNGATTTRSSATINVTPTGAKVANGKLSQDIYIAFFPDAGAKQGDEGTVTLMTTEGNTYQLKWQSSSAYVAGNMYVLKGKMDKVTEFNIEFKDPNVKNILTKSAYSDADRNKDGEISNIEASLVTDLNYMFMETPITSFDEFSYFTGITAIYGDNAKSGGFINCQKLESIVLPSSMKIIGHDSFYGCKSLKSVTIPDSVVEIDAGAFRDCI